MRIQKWIGLAVAAVVIGACAQSGSSNTTQISNVKKHQLLVKLCTQPMRFQCVNQPFTVTLVKRNGSTYRHTFEPPIPVIQKQDITVFAGQILNIEVTPGKDGQLKQLKLVEKVTHPDSTLVLKLEQESDKGMTLEVHNPFPRSLLYKAEIRPLGRKRFMATDVCPVGPRLENFESWLGPLIQVRLTDMHLVSLKGGVVTC
ncbi:MAG: hypothetical protein WCB49_10555 [Gammaproteobacteria bacterium]